MIQGVCSTEAEFEEEKAVPGSTCGWPVLLAELSPKAFLLRKIIPALANAECTS